MKITANQELSYRAIMAAIIKQAYIDIVEPPPRTKKEDIYSAMEFLLGETCACYCSETGKDYNRLWRQAAEAFRRMVA